MPMTPLGPGLDVVGVLMAEQHRRATEFQQPFADRGRVEASQDFRIEG
jgi:hypothetical protein